MVLIETQEKKQTEVYHFYYDNIINKMCKCLVTHFEINKNINKVTLFSV